MSGMCITSGCTTYIDGDDAICDECIAAVHHEAGARGERARIVAMVRSRLPALPYHQWDARAFETELIADALERGEHEEKTNG